MKPLSPTFYIAGVKYSDAHRITHAPPGTVVEVTHQPDNKFDAFALVCSILGIRVGHIPRTEQAAWFYHIFHNVNVVCRVVEWDTTKPPFEQIKVVFECDDKYMTQVVKQGVFAP